MRDYLLSPSHPVGRFKAMFFATIGYSQANWEVLVADLAQLAVDGDAIQAEATTFGQKFEVRGKLTSPSGRRALIVSVWIVLTGEFVPRFVTAFPAAK